jgi:hypothetical protein
MKLKPSGIERQHSYDKTDATHSLSRKRRKRGQWRSKRKMIIQNMAYAQQSQKQETENSNITNPKPN